jgi:peptide-methionine (R)-S-oxide reductase
VQYHVIRKKGTEAPGTGEYNKGSFDGGHFECRACKAKLYE